MGVDLVLLEKAMHTMCVQIAEDLEIEGLEQSFPCSTPRTKEELQLANAHLKSLCLDGFFVDLRAATGSEVLRVMYIGHEQS